MRRAKDLAPHAKDLLGRSVEWMDRFWDEKTRLLWDMGETVEPGSVAHLPRHMVRETAWYALGLLMRDGPGDSERAARALESVLVQQFDEPGSVHHGTFRRAPEEPHPSAHPVEWKDYDPNWREFIITTISVILVEFEDRLPRYLIGLLDMGIRAAVEGARARPLRAGYTNIALMHAQMLVYAGHRLDEPGWVAAGEAIGREVYRLFKLHDAFEEYNSPTYYGPDLYALGLWQAYCPSTALHEMGAEMEAVLWRDIARFYHAGLRNMAGPYDRAYGMDMRRYVAILGEWIWLVTGREHAPFPDLDRPFAHAADFCFGPLVAILGARVPGEILPHFLAFLGERCVEHVLADAPRRFATAWLDDRMMIGAEHTSRAGGGGQFHPATIHWQVALDYVGWVRLMNTDPVDAVASPRQLEVTGIGAFAFRIDAPGLSTAVVTPDRWLLPGLEVNVHADLPGTVEMAGGQMVVRYAEDAGQEARLVLELR